MGILASLTLRKVEVKVLECLFAIKLQKSSELVNSGGGVGGAGFSPRKTLLVTVADRRFGQKLCTKSQFVCVVLGWLRTLALPFRSIQLAVEIGVF